MKVILLADVPQVGRRHEVKNVSDGYAANFLFPRKLAQPATGGNLRRIEVLKKQSEGERELQVALFQKNIEALKDIKLHITMRANDQGHLFEGLHVQEITTSLKDEFRIDLDPAYLKLTSPLKRVGEHVIDVEGHGHRGVLTVVIDAL